MDKLKITITPADITDATDSKNAVKNIVARTLNVRPHVVNLYTDRPTLMVCTHIGTDNHTDYHLPDRLARLISQARNGKRIVEPRTFTLRRMAK